MTFEVDIAGRTRTVSVEHDGSSAGRFRVLLDGTAYVVDAARIGDFGLSLLGAAPAAPLPFSRDVQIAPSGDRGEVLVSLGGRIATVRINGRRTGRAAERGAHAPGEQVVSAPMPGRVIRVLVGPGDAVSARQAVIVVEAMKMENELRSPKAGRVKEVTVTPGVSVDAGKVLVVIE